MKVILQENVDNLGYVGDILDVANGYARNYLLPQKIQPQIKNILCTVETKIIISAKKYSILMYHRISF